jgi:hypothetical protein
MVIYRFVNNSAEVFLKLVLQIYNEQENLGELFWSGAAMLCFSV